MPQMIIRSIIDTFVLYIITITLEIINKHTQKIKCTDSQQAVMHVDSGA